MKTKHENIILIAGAGQNTGKTTLACKLIKHLSKRHSVIGVKISPHSHDIEKTQKIIRKTADFILIEEQLRNEKDSAMMLKAGAEKVFYIQSKRDALKNAFSELLPYIKHKAVICESGGLPELIEAGIFFFMHKGNKIPENKRPILESNPIMLDIFNPDCKFNPNHVEFSEQKFSYKSISEYPK